MKSSPFGLTDAFWTRDNGEHWFRLAVPGIEDWQRGYLAFAGRGEHLYYAPGRGDAVHRLTPWPPPAPATCAGARSRSVFATDADPAGNVCLGPAVDAGASSVPVLTVAGGSLVDLETIPDGFIAVFRVRRVNSAGLIAAVHHAGTTTIRELPESPRDPRHVGKALELPARDRVAVALHLRRLRQSRVVLRRTRRVVRGRVALVRRRCDLECEPASRLGVEAGDPPLLLRRGGGHRRRPDHPRRGSRGDPSLPPDGSQPLEVRAPWSLPDRACVPPRGGEVASISRPSQVDRARSGRIDREGVLCGRRPRPGGRVEARGLRVSRRPLATASPCTRAARGCRRRDPGRQALRRRWDRPSRAHPTDARPRSAEQPLVDYAGAASAGVSRRPRPRRGGSWPSADAAPAWRRAPRSSRAGVPVSADGAGSRRSPSHAARWRR